MDIIIKKNIYTFQDITSSQLANRRKSSAEIQSRLKYIMDAVSQQSRRINFKFLILSISIISLPHTLSALLSLKCLHIYLICLTSLRDSGTFEIKSRSALYKLQSYPYAHFINWSIYKLNGNYKNLKDNWILSQIILCMIIHTCMYWRLYGNTKGSLCFRNRQGRRTWTDNHT